MLSFLLSVINTRECTFHGENIGACFQLFIYAYPCSGIFRFLHSKPAGSKVEEWTQFWEDQGEDSAFFGFHLVVATVHEYILFPGMTMQITVEQYPSFIMNVSQQLFGVPYSRVELPMWHLPSSIQITSSQWAPIISIDNSIWIKHRNDFKDIFIPEDFSLLVMWVCYKVQHSSHHPWANSFTRVDTWGNDDSSLFLHDLEICLFSNC